MKKLIFLLLFISATALTAQNYQYFTAKQGIPKALEIAKDHFKNDSVNLYSIRCVIFVGIDTTEWGVGGWSPISLEGINHYNDSNGTSLYWYYLIGDTNKCSYFKVRKTNDAYEVDTLVNDNDNTIRILNYINIEDLIIDSDELRNSIINCASFRFKEYTLEHLIFFKLFIGKCINLDFQEDLIWEYDEGFEDHGTNMEALEFHISAITGKCNETLLDIFDNNNNSYIKIKSDPNTDNIIIEFNSDLFQVAELKLYDQVGVLLFADKLNNKSYELSTYNYPSGLYILQIKYGGNVITKTVMVVH